MAARMDGVSIHYHTKKGDEKECSNYRTNAPISHASKVLLKIILGRIQTKIEDEIAVEQAGFRPGRGTRDQITNLRIIIQKAGEHRQPLYMCFVDFHKAFDCIKHGRLWITMLEMGFPPHLVNIINKLYKGQKAAVRIAGVLTEWFRIGKGARQGCILSPYLFNIVAEMAMREALETYKGGYKIGGRKITNLRYADDIVLIAESPEELQDLVQRLVEAGQKYGLIINQGKTRVMATDKRELNIHIEGSKLKQIDHIQYLGATITEDDGSEEDMRARLGMAKNVLSGMGTIWKNKGITTPTKLRLLRTLIWPIATYGSEAWTYRKSEIKRIKAFETTSYRRILRIHWTAKKRNEEGLKEVGGKQLWGEIEKRKVKTFGHIMRKTTNCLEKDIILGETEGSRGRGRPRRMWMDDVMEWTELTLEQVVHAAQQRVFWRRIVHGAAEVRVNE